MVEFSLCARLKKSIRLGLFPVHIDPSFQVVLKCNEVLSDSMLSENDKIDICCSLFIKHRWILHLMPEKKRQEFFRVYFDSFVHVGKQKKGTKKVLDFSQDAQYIYSSFWQCYGLDLLGKDRRLHWWSFVALLGGLSDDTRLMQVISIRTRPLPKPTKYNQEERVQLIKLKQMYKLNLSEEERKRQFQEGLAKIATALHTLAERP